MPPRPRIRIPAPLAREMIDHSKDVFPFECCGLLLGIKQSGDCLVVSRVALTNVLASATEFESDPAEMLAAHRRMRREGLEMLAVYHSHPTSAPIPSRKDRIRSLGAGIASVIIGPDGTLRAWWLLSDADHLESDLEVFTDDPSGDAILPLPG